MKQYKTGVYIIILMTVFFRCSAPQESDTSKNGKEVFEHSEPHRPQFHFSPPSMWMNDPNGMVYHDGEYHLFYQHYPDSTIWGPMHWGHAVSNNMVQWEHLPIALYPDSLGYIFSGSAVVDIHNTSGLGTADSPALVAIFTYHDPEGEKAGRNDYQNQGIAFSLDKGRSWTKYENNPVLETPGIKDFRDPKVFWHEEQQKWIMALAVTDHISFYSSTNLIDWKLESDFGKALGAHGGVWECPDLFKLKIEGSDQEKWILLVSINPGAPQGGSGTQYFVGDFDGKTFTPDQKFMDDAGEEGIWIDYGRDNYAGVTWANIADEDGRRLFMGWMSNWAYANVVPTNSWRSAMTVPRTLSLAETAAGLRIVSYPAKELESLHAATYNIEPQAVSNTLIISDNLPFITTTFDIELELKAEKGFLVELSNDQNQKVIIGYDANSEKYFIDRTSAGNNNFSDDFGGIHYGPRWASDSTINLKLLVDVASVELFADGGKTVMTDIFFPDTPFKNIHLTATNGPLQVNSGKVVKMNSIWKTEE